jgi:hypothetical protein
MGKGLNECPGCGRCEHGEQAHAALDEGVAAAWARADTSANPHEDILLKQAWLAGHREGLRVRKG